MYEHLQAFSAIFSIHKNGLYVNNVMTQGFYEQQNLVDLSWYLRT